MELYVPRSLFTLKTCDISTSNVVNDYPLFNIRGSISQYRTSLTWNSINIQNIIGRDMYALYDTFNIEMVSAEYAVGTTVYGMTADDLCIQFGMSGLDWVGSNYSIVTLNKSAEAIVGATQYGGQAVADVNTFLYRPVCTFRKCITTNISISLYTVLGIPPNMNVGSIYPQMSFAFIVTPVK